MRALPVVVRLAAMLGFLGAIPASAHWKLEQDVEPPSYAVIEPESSELNIDSVVLACEEAGDPGSCSSRSICRQRVPCCSRGPRRNSSRTTPVRRS